MHLYACLFFCLRGHIQKFNFLLSRGVAVWERLGRRPVGTTDWSSCLWPLDPWYVFLLFRPGIDGMFLTLLFLCFHRPMVTVLRPSPVPLDSQDGTPTSNCPPKVKPDMTLSPPRLLLQPTGFSALEVLWELFSSCGLANYSVDARIFKSVLSFRCLEVHCRLVRTRCRMRTFPHSPHTNPAALYYMINADILCAPECSKQDGLSVVLGLVSW